MQGYAFTTNMFISDSNSSVSRQAFPSFWARRSGRIGQKCQRNLTGMIVSSIMDDPKKDDLYGFLRKYRKGCVDGSFYANHLTLNKRIEDRRTL